MALRQNIYVQSHDGNPAVFMFEHEERLDHLDLSRFLGACAEACAYNQASPHVTFMWNARRYKVDTVGALAAALKIVGDHEEVMFEVQPRQYPGSDAQKMKSTSVTLLHHNPAIEARVAATPRSGDPPLCLFATVGPAAKGQPRKQYGWFTACGRRALGDESSSVTFVLQQAPQILAAALFCGSCLEDTEEQVLATRQCSICGPLCGECDRFKHRGGVAAGGTHVRDTLASTSSTQAPRLTAEALKLQPPKRTIDMRVVACINCSTSMESSCTMCPDCNQATQSYPVMLFFHALSAATDDDVPLAEASALRRARQLGAAAAVVPRILPRTDSGQSYDWTRSALELQVDGVTGVAVEPCSMRYLAAILSADSDLAERRCAFVTVEYTTQSEASQFNLVQHLATRQAEVDDEYGLAVHTLNGNGTFTCGHCRGTFKCSKALKPNPSAKARKVAQGATATQTRVCWNLHALKRHMSTCTPGSKRSATDPKHSMSGHGAAMSMLLSSTPKGDLLPKFLRSGSPISEQQLQYLRVEVSDQLHSGSRKIADDQCEVAPSKFVRASVSSDSVGLMSWMKPPLLPCLEDVTPQELYFYNERQRYLRDPASYRPVFWTSNMPFSAPDESGSEFWPGYSDYMKDRFVAASQAVHNDM